MITKEQAQLALKAVNPVTYDGDELTRQLAETVIALHERVERLTEALIWCSGSADFGEGGIARKGWLKLCEQLLKETTHD